MRISETALQVETYLAERLYGFPTDRSFSRRQIADAVAEMVRVGYIPVATALAQDIASTMQRLGCMTRDGTILAYPWESKGKEEPSVTIPVTTPHFLSYETPALVAKTM